MMLDVTFYGAALAGLLSFLSPCILPIVPFYLSYMAGVGMHEISADASIDAGVRRRAVLTASAFAAGIVTVFMVLGLGAAGLGHYVADTMGWLRWVAAVVIAVLGLHFLGILRIPLLYRQFRAEPGSTSNMSVLGAYLIGLAFAFGWTPCVGPVLAAILITAAGAGTLAKGAGLLFVYGVGMALPFVIAAFFIGPFMRFMARFRRHLGVVEKAMGILLLVFAVLIGTDSVNEISNWLLQFWPEIG